MSQVSTSSTSSAQPTTIELFIRSCPTEICHKTGFTLCLKHIAWIELNLVNHTVSVVRDQGPIITSPILNSSWFPSHSTSSDYIQTCVSYLGHNWNMYILPHHKIFFFHEGHTNMGLRDNSFMTYRIDSLSGMVSVVVSLQSESDMDNLEHLIQHNEIGST